MPTTSSRDEFTAYTGQDADDVSPRSKKKISKRKSGTRRDALTGQVILTKEGDAEDIINFEDIRKKLANLKENADVKIRKLSGQLKEDFDSLAQYVAWIYNTDSYPLLYQEIQNYFCESDTYQPGTIGAYCGGCLVKKKDGLLTRGCSVICAGSIPPPYNDPDWDFCADLVIWASYNGENYEFTTLNEIEDEKDDKAIIFIEQDSIEAFPGFNEAEKRTLKEHGIHQVRLIYYNPEKDPMYKEVSGGYINIDQTRTRVVPPLVPVAPVVITTNGWNWWMVILVAVILIALFFFLCRCSGGVNW